MDTIDQPQLTLKEVAALYRCSKRYVYDQCRSGVMPGAWKAGKCWRIPAWGAQQFMDERRRVATAEPQEPGEEVAVETKANVARLRRRRAGAK
jgi:excisionase family DNA binding protein